MVRSIYNILQQMQGIKQSLTVWYYSRPLFTRTYLSICILFTVLISLNLISSYHIFYTFEETFFKLHIWRPLTTFLFIQKLDIAFVVSLYVLYFSLYRLEKSIQTGLKYAQFLWMILILLVCCIAVGTFIKIYFLTDIFIISLVYISSRKVSSQRMHIFSKIYIQSTYLPFFYLIMMFFLGHQIINQVIGLILGALYVYIQQIGARNSKKDFISPPKFLSTYCERLIRPQHVGN